MIFIRVSKAGLQQKQFLHNINDAESLGELFKRIYDADLTINDLECYVGTNIDFDKKYLFQIDTSTLLGSVQQSFPNFSRLLFDIKPHEQAFQYKTSENLNTVLMAKARELQFPDFDAKAYPGENRLWNKICGILKTFKTGFYQDETCEMDLLMKTLFNALW